MAASAVKIEWHKLIPVFIATLFVTVTITGCAPDGVKCADSSMFGGWHECSPIQISYDYQGDEATTRARLESYLNPGDGISINIGTSISPAPMGPAITITDMTFNRDSLSIITKDHWLDQASADAITATLAAPNGVNGIDRIVEAISKIHDWQRTHPRPASSTSPPIPMPPQNDAAESFAKILEWCGIAGMVICGGLILLRIARQAIRRLRRSWMRRRQERQERYRAAMRRAEYQTELAKRGDPRGIYGDYTPADYR